MRWPVLFAGFLVGLTSPSHAADPLPKPLVMGLKGPRAIAVGTDGRIYVAEARGIMVITNGKSVPFATGLKDATAIVAWQNGLFVAGPDRIWHIDAKGIVKMFADVRAFARRLVCLSDIAVDEQGTLYGLEPRLGARSAIYRISPRGKVTLVTNGARTPMLDYPTSVVLDGMSHLVVADVGAGTLIRINIADGKATRLAARFRGADGLFDATGLAWDVYGRLFVSDRHRVHVIPRPGEQPVLLAEGFQSAGDICLDPTRQFILVPDRKAGTLTALRTTVPGQEVDETPLPIKSVVAFPKLKWAGWQGVTDAGRVVPLRPIVLTHAGDRSKRIFVATQHGVVHAFPGDPTAAKTQIFLDIQDRVAYQDNQNEEGLLGLVFHPRFKTNGEFLVFYTTNKTRQTNVLSRFRLRKDDPTRADPASEEVLLRIVRPYWNHDGGTICFGPDGYLYIALGDGGAANDPHRNGQNLKTLLAKVLRIDVDRKDPGKNYAVPRDNPFVGKKDALPEIWAYGLRNVWRMAFDHGTGKLWAADVGQNLYEEIDIIVKGGNYGWSLREGLHPFGPDGAGVRKDLIDPIWEYHHDVGKSLTGGTVYRGKTLSELQGAYLYGDYVTTRIWALWYDEARKRVVANRPVGNPGQPILSFGEDENGEVYFMAATVSGKGIYRFARSREKHPTRTNAEKP